MPLAHVRGPFCTQGLNTEALLIWAGIVPIDRRPRGDTCCGAESSGWVLQASDLAAQIESDRAAGLQPFFLCATIGTTSTAAVDPVRELGQISKSNKIW